MNNNWNNKHEVKKEPKSANVYCSSGINTNEDIIFLKIGSIDGAKSFYQ